MHSSSSIHTMIGLSVLFSTFLNIYSHAHQSINPDSLTLHQLFAEHDAWRKSNSDKLYPDVLPTAQLRTADTLNSLLDRLHTINFKSLKRADQINYRVFEYILKNRRDLINFEMYLIPFNAEGGFYNELTGAVRRAQFQAVKDVEEYLDRLKAYPNYLKDNISLLKIGMAKGIVSSKLIARNYAVLIEPFIDLNLSKNTLFKPFAERPKSISEAKWADLSKKGASLIQDGIIPTYLTLDSFMQESYIPAARDKPGISGVPHGREIYAQRIAYFTSLDLNPDQVFQRGQEEVARIRTEMEGIISGLQFEGTFAEFLDFLRTDPQFYASTPKSLLMHASYIAKKIDGLLPKYFDHLPRLPYGVQPVPEALAPNYTGGRYSGGSWENHRAGNYWVNTYKLESRPLYVLPALTLHEAVPGHHLQISLAQELGELPGFRKREYISAFGEGWALYTEWLGKEMGIYETPYEDFGRLTYEMWRACRLVVDVGLHHKNWSREQAFDFLSTNTALSLHECNTEINRYIGWPGQAVSYKIGELKIRELRAKAERTLGADFNLREFHDVILRNGSVPLFILEEEVDHYLATTKSP